MYDSLYYSITNLYPGDPGSTLRHCSHVILRLCPVTQTTPESRRPSSLPYNRESV